MSINKKSKKSNKISPETAKAIDELERLRKLDHAYVVLSIWHNALSPNEIGEILKLQSTSSLQKGEELYQSENYDISSPANYWSMSSEGQVTSPEVELHIEWLLGTLSGKVRAIRQLQKKEREDENRYSNEALVSSNST